MSLLPRIGLGQVSNDGQGDPPRVAGQKINEAFATLETLVDPSPAIAAADQAAGSAQSAAESLLAIGASVQQAEDFATAADQSAQAAATSEQNAATSEQNAATSEQNAATSEQNAATSEQNAATSEGNAETAKNDAVTAKNDAVSAKNDAESAADTATTQAGIATTQAGIATTQAGISAAEAARLQGTSTSSVAIATGSTGFTTQAGKAFDVGTFVLIRSDADPTVDWVFGQVTAYSSTSLTVNVTAIGGSGTHADWTIYGRVGPRGAPAAGTGDFVGLASSTAGHLVSFADTTGTQAGDSGVVVSTDGTLASNSDGKLPTEKAVKTYADSVAANATSVAAIIHAATGKSTPVDADELGLIDSAASWGLKKFTWGNLKAALKATTAQILAGTSPLFMTVAEFWGMGAEVALSPGYTVTVTFTNGSPNVVFGVPHGLQVGQPVHLTTSGSLPTNFVAATEYYIKTVVDVNTVELSATRGGSAISAGSAGSGTHIFHKRIWLNFALGINFVLNPIIANWTLSKPHNAKPGQVGRIRMVQDSTGGWTIAIPTDYKAPGGLSNITLSTPANADDVINYDTISTSRVDLAIRKDNKA